MRLCFLALVLTLIPSISLASGPGPKRYATYPATIAGAAFTGQAINAAKALDAVNVGGYETVLVEVAYVYSSATDVLMTCVQGPLATSVFVVPEVQGAGSGVVNHYPRTWRWITGAASASFFFEVPIRYQWLRCTFVGTGAGANDKITVSLRAQE
jgi:hypothetical protein